MDLRYAKRRALLDDPSSACGPIDHRFTNTGSSQRPVPIEVAKPKQKGEQASTVSDEQEHKH